MISAAIHSKLDYILLSCVKIYVFYLHYRCYLYTYENAMDLLPENKNYIFFIFHPIKHELDILVCGRKYIEMKIVQHYNEIPYTKKIVHGRDAQISCEVMYARK